MLSDPLSREPGRLSIWYPFHQGRNVLPQTPASMNTFQTGPEAVPHISCDVTHHSGVFTAYHASQRGSTHSLPFFPKHVWSSRDELFVSGGAPSTSVSQVTTFSNMFHCEHKQPSGEAETEIQISEGRGRRRGHPLHLKGFPSSWGRVSFSLQHQLFVLICRSNAHVPHALLFVVLQYRSTLHHQSKQNSRTYLNS